MRKLLINLVMLILAFTIPDLRVPTDRLLIFGSEPVADCGVCVQLH